MQPFRLILKLHVYVFPIKGLVYWNKLSKINFHCIIFLYLLFTAILYNLYLCLHFIFSDKVVLKGFYLPFEGSSSSFAILKSEQIFFTHCLGFLIWFDFLFFFFTFLKNINSMKGWKSTKRWQQIVTSDHKHIACCC